MLLDFKITLHFHYGGKFEEMHNKIHYIGEIGCTKFDYDYDKLQTPSPFMSLSSIMRATMCLKKQVFMVVTVSSHNY